MKKFSSEIELRGHLIDSLILTKVFDGIMDHGGSFEVLDIQVGKKKTGNVKKQVMQVFNPKKAAADYYAEPKKKSNRHPKNKSKNKKYK